MRLYVDTSVWVTIFALERDTERATLWLEDHSQDEIIISPWVRTEFASALSLKIRTRQIGENERTGAASRFAAATEMNLRESQILSIDFTIAARWCALHETGLRAGDALHLAIASRNEVTLCTLDKRLHEAGKMLGVQTLLV